MTDEELIDAFAKGNTSALETLVYRYHTPIHAYLTRMMHSRILADDLSQDCFMRVIHAARQGRIPQNFKPWLYKIATNLCRDYWRKAANQERPVSDLDIIHTQTADNVSLIYEKQVNRELLILALKQLKPDRREVVILRYFQDLKLEEISDILDIPLSTVKSKLYDSIRSLNKLLTLDDTNQPAAKHSITGGGAAK